MKHDPARARHMMISLHRFLGVGLVLLGILVAQRVVEWPEPVGWTLIVLGIVDVFVVPLMLARMWRTPK